jgi:hypothetical protein
MKIAPRRYRAWRCAPRRSAPVKSEPRRSAPPRSAPRRSAPVKSAPDEDRRVGEVRANQVRAAEIQPGTDEEPAAEVDPLAVISGIATPDDGEGGLYIWPHSALGRVSTELIIRWKRLAGMLTDKRAQDLHHSGVVPDRVAGHPLQGVNAADPHIEFV